MNLSNNKILITGGATGIGFGLSKKFLELNNTVIICGRRADKLLAVAEKYPNVITKVCDLGNEKSREDLYNWVKENHSDVNVLVNNAGIQNWIDVTDENFFENATTEITTNVLAPIHLTSLFVNLATLNTIINVTSGLAFVPLAKVAVYSATKAFFRSFTLSLRHNLQAKNIEVIEMIPPALNTDLGGVGVHDGMPEVSDFVESVFQQMQDGKNELSFGMSTDRLNANNEKIKDVFAKMNP